MSYKIAVEKINSIQKRRCFSEANDDDISYLQRLNLPEEVVAFYKDSNPNESIEMNGVRLLPISEIKEENINYTPGYLLAPLGYCVIASTIEGDVYCIHYTSNDYSIILASHDEIYEGQETEQIINGTKEVVKSFQDFLNSFAEQGLVVSFYDLE